MAINESVQYALNQTNWKARTLVEVANAGQLFLITEAEFDRILEAEQLDEGVKEWIAKAREFAKKLPANLQQAQQAVVKATGKALDNTNQAYFKAQQLINKIPLIGRIPEQTRNRLMLGLALSFAAGMGTDASAADSGGGDIHAGAAADHATAGHGAAGHTGDPTGGGDGTTPAPEPAPVTTGSGTEADPHTTATNISPESHAQAVGYGEEGNRTFADMMKDAGPNANHNMLRNQFHSVCDRMAAGDASGAKLAASALSQKMNLDEESKKVFLQLLMKVGQTAKANGVKMH